MNIQLERYFAPIIHNTILHHTKNQVNPKSFWTLLMSVIYPHWDYLWIWSTTSHLQLAAIKPVDPKHFDELQVSTISPKSSGSNL